MRSSPVWGGLLLSTLSTLSPACNGLLNNQAPGESATGGAGGADDGLGGEGGEPPKKPDPVDEPPTLGGPCDESVSLACDVTEPSQKLACGGTKWVSAGRCADGQNCDPAQGECAAIVSGCADRDEGDTFCSAGDEIFRCGANLVSTALVERCEGRCVASSRSALCVPASCGDGRAQEGEACDDGNSNNTDACTELCKAPFCGDGFENGTEDCDDADSNNTDSCTELCKPPFCGDGFTNDGEECDDANTDNDDGCTELCKAPVCGDGFTNDGEGCDDSNHSAGDGCDPDCAPEIIKLTSREHTVCALRADGQLKCWGNNSYGQLGQGSIDHLGDNAGEMGAALPPIDLGSGREVRQVAVGALHVCAVLDDGGVKCWGFNGFEGNGLGSLGLGDEEHRGDEPGEMGDALPSLDLGSASPVTDIVAGAFHTCALFEDGTVKCWGQNTQGQLGLDHLESVGDGPNEMGLELPTVPIPGNRKVIALTAGTNHTCVIVDSGIPYCWGQNDLGQLGLGDNVAKWKATNPVLVGSGLTAVAIAAGGAHNCMILSDSTVKCWGFNEYGQLGLDDIGHRGDQPSEMGDSLMPVNLGLGAEPLALGLGTNQTCVALTDGRVKCWGFGTWGGLGLGDTRTRGDGAEDYVETIEMGDALPAVDLGAGQLTMAVSSGMDLGCVLLKDASVKCWGANDKGQLGQGDGAFRGNQPGTMSDSLLPVALW